MATLFPVPQFFDNNGNPLSAGHLYWSQAGTTTAKQTWKNEDESTPHVLAYITLDGNGRAPGGAIFIRGSYKLVVKNSDESVTYYTIDNINEYNAYDFTGLTASAADLNSTTTSSKDISGVAPLVYTVLLTDRGKTLMVNTLTASATINLPSAVTVGNTFKIWIKKTDNSINTVTIIPYGAQTIDGATSKILYDYNDFIEVRSDGTNWFIGGSLIRGTISTASTATVLALTDNGRIFNCNCTGGSFNMSLPACATVGRGYWIGIKKIDSSANHITVVPSGAATIDGATSYFVNVQWQFTIFKTDGVNWFIMEESHSSTETVTGDVKAAYNYLQNGWLLMNDGSIGDASSGATRANADTQALFILLWTVISDAICPVYNGAIHTGRGTSALADFNAHRMLYIPKALGRALTSVGLSDAGGPNFAIGQKYGAPTHTNSVDEMVNHNHPYLYRTNEQKQDGASTACWTGSGVQNTGNTGNNLPYSIYQPLTAVYFLIKL
jgi:hypothetical protein